nr:immunoglobulin light chain junction region [Macaca mulatta]MOV85081.1 immunoglobulin light chain junction region [Macaca mulatta]MOV85554.1 immunoglobulin light chain junction region [Macaca mulatta]
CLQYNSNPPTF